VRQEALAEGKPESVVDKMVDGRMKKYTEEVCLLDQPWVKDPEKTIRQLIQETVAKTSENIQVRRFARYQLGE
jgi:elongation factor Ts